MNNTKLRIAELDEKLKKLIEKTHNILEETDNSEIKQKLILEFDTLQSRTDLKVAFVGQYSSGKSTIISALTGNKSIKIDANVATDVVTEYSWNNVILMDTPGILAGKVERHDEATKEALKNSDLIVYVITSQLFDDIVFENFIDLAYSQRLKDKILIALNKMGMEAGEFLELQKNYLNAIKGIFVERGYDFDFDIVFIDAADYIEGIEDQDEDFIQISNFSKFISTLNSFVDKKGIIKKQFDSPLRLLKNAVGDIALQQTNPDLHKLITQGENKIRASKRRLSGDLKILLNDLKQEIIEKGSILGSKIGEIDQETFDSEENQFNKYVKTLVERSMKKIEEVIKEEEGKIIDEMKEFAEKDSMKNFSRSLESKISVKNLSPSAAEKLQASSAKQKKFLKALTDGSAGLLDKTINPNAIGNGLKTASGSQVHTAVKQVGGFFGKKFKPWEAVKITGKIGKVAKFAGPALSTIGVGVDIYEKIKNDKQNKQIQESKNQFFTKIVSFGSEVLKEIDININDYFKNSYDSRLDLLNKQKIDLMNTELQNSKFSEAIKKLDSEYIDFIEIIEHNQ